MVALWLRKKDELIDERDFWNEAELRAEIVKAGLVQGLWPRKPRSARY